MQDLFDEIDLTGQVGPEGGDAEAHALPVAARHLEADAELAADFDEALRQVVRLDAPSLVVANETFHRLLTEAVANKIRGHDMSSLSDGSAIVTGMILAFSLPPSINPYMAFIGGAVAIALAKAVFGGLGHNLFNPAMVGRAFLMICFPAAMVALRRSMLREARLRARPP
mgnify:CR=1 FL=1